jgi:hypothetical protein
VITTVHYKIVYKKDHDGQKAGDVWADQLSIEHVRAFFGLDQRKIVGFSGYIDQGPAGTIDFAVKPKLFKALKAVKVIERIETTEEDFEPTLSDATERDFNF